MMIERIKKWLISRHYEKAELLIEIYRLKNIIEEQSATLQDRNIEIKRLRSIDEAIRDFEFARDSAKQDAFIREGFDDVIASRQPQPLYHCELHTGFKYDCPDCHVIITQTIEHIKERVKRNGR